MNQAIESHMCRTDSCPCSRGVRQTDSKWNSPQYAYDVKSEIVSFVQCYESLVEKDGSDAFVMDIGALHRALETVRYVETYAPCSGMCKPAPFFSFLDTPTYGEPEEGCLYKIQEKYRDAFYVLWHLILSSFFCLICVTALSYFLQKNPVVPQILDGPVDEQELI